MNAPVKSAALLFSCVAALAPPAQAVGFTITPAKDAIVEGADVSSMKISVADGTIGAALAADDGMGSITPAPEASTIFLMGAGALVIAGAMRVNRSRARKE